MKLKCPHHPSLAIEPVFDSGDDETKATLCCPVCVDKMAVVGRGASEQAALSAARAAWTATVELAVATAQLSGGSLRYVE